MLQINHRKLNELFRLINQELENASDLEKRSDEMIALISPSVQNDKALQSRVASLAASVGIAEIKDFIKEVCRVYDIPASTITKHLATPIRKQLTRITPSLIATIHLLHKQNVSVEDLSRKFQLSTKSIRDILNSDSTNHP